MKKESLLKSLHVWWLPLLACLLWLGFTVALYRHAAQVGIEHRLELEHTRLATVARQIMDARNWNAAHGGVYVLESDYGRANPWLPEHERTIRTADGQTLVLMNPAYMSRQLAERSSWPGIRIAVISDQPLRQQNHSNAWESQALEACMSGPHEIFSPPHKNGENSLRLLAVLTAQPSCLRCHTQSRAGDVLGGVSVSQDATQFNLDLEQHLHNLRLVFCLLAVTGVTAIGGLTLNLNRRRWQAVETSRMKSAFMARLSHDMRTPLTAIGGMSEILRNADSSLHEKEAALRYLSTAGNALLEMVSDITDHAALEQGSMVLRERDFSLRQCVNQCLEIYQPAARGKDLSLDLHVSPDAPDQLHGDDFRLRQALGNLISNAVKFTAEGGVSVRVATEMLHRQRGVRLRIDVEDSGPGLQAGEAERIFESFQRGVQAEGQPGTGLGLNIARTIARRMGGDVSVSPRTGSGSCFCLEVLLQLSCDSICRSADNRQISLAGRRILIAEDNAANRFYFEQALRKEGAVALSTADGEAALHMLNAADGPAANWDMLLLDLDMPRMNGMEVLQHIRLGHTRAPADQRVIICTAALDNATHDLCRQLKPDAVLLKPLSFAQLRHSLGALLAGKPATAATDREDTMPQKDSLPVWDEAGARAAMDDDADIFSHMLTVLVAELQRMDSELKAALADSDITTVRRLAHACKNSAGAMRLLRLQARAAQTEKAPDSHLAHEGQLLLAALAEALAALPATAGKGQVRGNNGAHTDS
ncbi:MAG: response regulator [Desulfovibrio sp.]|nr:response regulator [Desulfovibrio sp.]